MPWEELHSLSTPFETKILCNTIFWFEFDLQQTDLSIILWPCPSSEDCRRQKRSQLMETILERNTTPAQIHKRRRKKHFSFTYA